MDNAIEKSLVNCVARSLLNNGYTIGVNNGGDDYEYSGRDLSKLMDSVNQTDEDLLEVWMEGSVGETNHGWVRLIYGNGIDVISDYTTNLESVMADADALREAMEGDKVIIFSLSDAEELLTALTPLCHSWDESSNGQCIKNFMQMLKGAR